MSRTYVVNHYKYPAPDSLSEEAMAHLRNLELKVQALEMENYDLRAALIAISDKSRAKMREVEERNAKLTKWMEEGTRTMDRVFNGQPSIPTAVAFWLGYWWSDRPWRTRSPG